MKKLFFVLAIMALLVSCGPAPAPELSAVDQLNKLQPPITIISKGKPMIGVAPRVLFCDGSGKFVTLSDWSFESLNVGDKITSGAR